MKAVLTTYKDRLVNISGRNRSLVLRKIYKKRSFDIVRAFREQDFDLNLLVSNLLQEEKKASLVIDDPFKTRNALEKLTNGQLKIDKEEELAALGNVLKNQESLSIEDEAIIRNRRKEIEDKYKILQTEELKRIDDKYDALLTMSNNMNYLFRETRAIEKESGKYEMFIGYPFVEGKFKDGTFVRAPFFLFPVEIELKNNQWFIKNNPARDPMVNKVFLFAGAKCHGSSVKDYDEFDFSQLNQAELMEFVVSELDSIGMVATKDKSDYLFLKTYTNATVPQFKPGELKVIPYMAVGQFPISNSIYTDYELLDDQGTLNNSLDQLLVNKNVDIDPKDKIFSGIELPRKDLFTIAPIDFSQETAIKALTKTDQLVIYGPPGTGKSQTIANMISDALSKGKKILMVSQKRAALDVLYNRLSPIQSKLMLIHDANKDKKLFFDKLRSQIEEGFDFISPQSRVQFEENANKVDSLLDELKHIENELTKERSFGISLQQMYNKSEGIFSADDPRYLYYRKFREDNPFMDYTYDVLDESFEKLNKQTFIVDTYFKYANLIQQFAYLPLFNRVLSFMEKESVQDSCEIVGTNIESLSKADRQIVKIINAYYSVKKLSMSDSELKRYGSDYNSELNNDLIEQPKVMWWNVPKVVSRALKKKERLQKSTKFESEKLKYEQKFLEVGHLVNDMYVKLEPILDVLNEAGKTRLVKDMKELNKSVLSISSLKASINNQAYYNELLINIHALDTADIMLLNYAFLHADDVTAMGVMLDNLLDFIILEHIHKIEKTESFNEFYLYFNRFSQITNQVNELSGLNETLTADIVKSVWNDKMQLFVGDANYKELKRQADKKRKLMPIRNMIFEFSNLLFTLYPCWLMSPETVSDVLPLQADLFDLIIFDEASQMFVENSIPTIYRGKKVVVAGDDKQLRPTSSFLARIEEEDEEFLDIETAAALEEESLLDLAKVNYDSVHLNYHYRSRYSELIQFSNHAFYNGRLNVSPNRVKYHYDGSSPIERIKVAGKWENRRNSVEANRIVELVDHLLKNRADNETIGIITFNITQKDLLEDLLESRCQIDETFKNLYQEELVRKKKDEDVSIFVKNIENVQGDERDIIIFSVGYAPNEQGKISVNFGSLSQDGGENRLNVAISRAKKKSYVVTSIEPEELFVNKTKNNGAKLFKKYLQFAKEVSDKNLERQNFLLEQLSDTKVKEIVVEDEFVEELANKLKVTGYTIELNVGSGKYKLDMAIWDENHKAFVLGIECDSMLYPNGQTTLERDIYRSRFYKARGWDVLRVWCYDWWKNPTTVLKSISEHLNENYQIEVDIEHPPIQTTQFHLVEAGGDESCWYGDRIQLKDLKSNEVFTIDIDATEDTKDDLNEFKKLLIDQRVNTPIIYRDYEYKIHSIMKLKD